MTTATKQQLKRLTENCIVAIWQFLPTADVARFLSNVKVLLNDDWQYGCLYVLNKRAPFSIEEDSLTRNAYPESFALIDNRGDTIAVIKRPEYFDFSPLADYVEDVTVPQCLNSYSYDKPDMRKEVRSLFAPLPCVKSLTLDLKNNVRKNVYPSIPALPNFNALAQFEADFRHHFPNLFSFNVVGDPLNTTDYTKFVDCLREMTALKRLSLAPYLFNVLMESLPERFSTLEALWVECDFGPEEDERERALNFIREHCSQIDELSLVVVRGLFPKHFETLRELRNLNSFSVQFANCERAIRIDPGQGLRILTVTEFYCMITRTEMQGGKLALLLHEFPNLKTLKLTIAASLKRKTDEHPLAIIGEIIGSRILPSLVRLSIGTDKWFQKYSSVFELFAFLSEPLLPKYVDLSEFGYFCLYEYGAEGLVDIVRTLERNAVQSLKLQGKVDSANLANLYEHYERSRYSCGSVRSWMDKDAPPAPHPGCFVMHPDKYYFPSDFHIGGVKLSGRARDKDYDIRIFNIGE